MSMILYGGLHQTSLTDYKNNIITYAFSLSTIAHLQGCSEFSKLYTEPKQHFLIITLFCTSSIIIHLIIFLSLQNPTNFFFLSNQYSPSEKHVVTGTLLNVSKIIFLLDMNSNVILSQYCTK